MRELERPSADINWLSRGRAPGAGDVRSVAVVGRGRVGTALAGALADAGLAVDGPLGRGAAPDADAVLLCVPDAQIEVAAATAAGGSSAFVGHTSGATPLDALAPAARAGAETFGLHPLQTITGEDAPGDAARRLAGVGCAVAGSSAGALRIATRLAERLGMAPFAIEDVDRPAYHAAASVASNFLVTLEDAAEALAGGAGLGPDEARRALLPLVRSTVDNWAALGPERALTGPVARGDDATSAAQRSAVAERRPELLPLFDALVDRTRALARRSTPEAPTPALATAVGGPEVTP